MMHVTLDMTSLLNMTSVIPRQLLILNEVRPEDGGVYQVEVKRDGFRSVSQTVTLKVSPPLTADWGPKDAFKTKWKFQVQF